MYKCESCLYFRVELESDDSERYHCDLHELHDDEVSHPDFQSCDSWISSKVKTRINNLKELGI